MDSSIVRIVFSAQLQRHFKMKLSSSGHAGRSQMWDSNKIK